ncbi:hypothetical protein [Streptomyces sp. PT12]|uniref:hypothetical protein n=1 Tax=Streptomyces sp. PT12 TaxID=1510197 RepID=UPI0011BF32D8|nr:hypothetical protein [Streptomyces sp. PT12]
MTARTTRATRITRAELEAELARYLSITGHRFATGQESPQMFSGLIDRVWHEKMQDPVAYAEFCAAHAGEPVAHAPVTGSGPVNWIVDYERRFGTLPDAWFMGADGVVNEPLRREYHRTGAVTRAEWICSPRPTHLVERRGIARGTGPGASGAAA